MLRLVERRKQYFLKMLNVFSTHPTSSNIVQHLFSTPYRQLGLFTGYVSFALRKAPNSHRTITRTYCISLNGMVEMVHFCFFLVLVEFLQHFVIGLSLSILCWEKNSVRMARFRPFYLSTFVLFPVWTRPASTCSK